VSAEDPGLAERALRLVLAVQPEHAGARELLAAGTPASAGSGTTSAALRGFPEIWDLIASHGLGKNDDWTYGEGRIDVRVGKGQLDRTPSGYDSGATYGYEAEIVLNAVPTPDRVSAIGLTFGWGPDDGYTLLIVKERLELGTIGKRGKMVLETAPLPPWQPAKRRTLAVRVEKGQMRGYVDGRSLVQRSFDADARVGGDVGLVLENVEATFHRLVLARPAGGGK
jgi:hypothetical protein